MCAEVSGGGTFEACDNKAEVEPSYLGLEGAKVQLQVLGNPLLLESNIRGWRCETAAHLSVISHDDQLHILGCGLDVAPMLQRASKERKSTGTGGQNG